MSENKSEQIKAMLEPLIVSAERNGMWLRSKYQAVDFSPKELRACLAQDRFVWGPVNWDLIDPRTLLKDEAAESRKVREHNEAIAKRMAG